MKVYRISQLLVVLFALQWTPVQSLSGFGSIVHRVGKAMLDPVNTVVSGLGSVAEWVSAQSLGSVWNYFGRAGKALADPGKAVASGMESVAEYVGAKDVDDLVSNVGKAIVQEVADVKNPLVAGITSIGSSQCENVKKLFGVDSEQMAGINEPDLSNLTLDFMAPGITTKYTLSGAARLLPAAQGLDPRQKLVLFMHGYTDSPNKTNFQNVNDAFQSTGHYNILALDAAPLRSSLYLRSSTYVRFIGERLGETLAAMLQHGLKPKNIHLVGHSLGAHISAFAGKKFTELTGRKVGRLTGLDPAGPCFSHVDEDLRLKATDAEFVDAIHTDAGVYGITDPVGHVDFYPNGGSLQPDCFLESCSHSRAVELFAESITNRTAFPAVRCDSYDDFKNGKTSKGHNRNYMGLGASPSKKGKFYLQTNVEAPYGSGEKGLQYENRDGFVRSLLVGSGIDDQVKILFGRKLYGNDNK